MGPYKFLIPQYLWGPFISHRNQHILSLEIIYFGLQYLFIWLAIFGTIPLSLSDIRVCVVVRSQIPVILSEHSPENKMRCVLFIFAFHICTFRPVTSVYSKRAMSNTPLSETAMICTFFFSNSALAVTRTKTVAVSGDDESKVTDPKLTTPYVTLAYFHQQVDLCCRICVVECVLSCWMEPLFSLEDLLELMSSRCDLCYFFLTPFEKILLR